MSIQFISTDLADARDKLLEAMRLRGFKGYSGQTKYGMFFEYEGDCTFQLSFLPGNRRTIVSHAVLIPVKLKGKGLGTKLCELRADACRAAGMTLMLATVRNTNAAEIRVLEKCGWSRFTNNHKTDCSLWGKTL